MKKISLFIPLLLLLFIIGCSKSTNQSLQDSSTNNLIKNSELVVGIDVGNLAPNFTLKTLQGEEISLANLKGQPIMIDFWADWCPFCVKEFPVMEKAYQKYKDQGFMILAVHRTNTESRERAKEFISNTNPSFTILLDLNDDVYTTFSKGLRAMPLTLFVNKEGIITKRILGPKNLEQLDALIQEIL